MENSWSTLEELATLEEETKKALLTDKLNLKLNDSVHTVVDLSLRAISAEQGGLCGLGAIYQALDGTLLTKSQLRSMAYEQLVEVMADEMLMELKEALKKSDAEMLMHFHDCKYFLLFFNQIPNQGCVLKTSGRKSSTMMPPLACSLMKLM